MKTHNPDLERMRLTKRHKNRKDTETMGLSSEPPKNELSILVKRYSDMYAVELWRGEEGMVFKQFDAAVYHGATKNAAMLSARVLAQLLEIDPSLIVFVNERQT